MDADDVEDLALLLKAHGEPANIIHIHPDVIARLQLIEARRQHWYWRLWWRVRYAPMDMIEALAAKLAG